MASGEIVEVHLRRMENTQSWGFKLKGGADVGIPLHVDQCNPKGRAGAAGMATGDAILALGGTDLTRMASGQIKQEMLRAGNELDFVIQKGAMLGATCAPGAAPQASGDEPRVQIVEEPTCKFGGPTYKDVNQKTFQVLESELPEGGSPAEPAPAAGGKPSSIFDRKKGERSGYLHSQGRSIQRAFGEQ